MDIKLTDYMSLEIYENKDIHPTGLLYRVFIPRVKRRKYKLFIYMHGSGERGIDGISHVERHAKILNYIIDHPIYGKETIIIAPQIPENERMVPLSDIKAGKYDFELNETTPIKTLIHEFIHKELPTKYKIDPQHMYIGGISMGATHAFDLIASFPGKFASGLLICGILDLKQLPKVKHTPLFMFHSSDDPVVPYQSYHNGYEILKSLGADVMYHEFNDTGHAVWNKAYEEPGLIDWIFTKKRIKPRF
ncbi:Predicted esterase [Acholeplasma oculi]|uniref:Phospholipase/carboxylesterase n=1 Tax=Acholeplasma oculi TaxID=35623 RepID=A0A061AAB7_9MOLU|nr:hypothetical protein [Acholeplasma oculi]CDR30773.1 Phospholipase/carboxylesterase [Acholeplasma oculi]SKC34923.1 Phospholipase/Carboxylesterase [Acholeplasma oculi]SUT89709.1 Predicted esterase [Acholeplasma oculi]